MASTPNTSSAVPMISVIRFATVLRIAGPVEKTASFRPGSSVSPQCDEVREPHEDRADEGADELPGDQRRGRRSTRTAPTDASPIVTAGFSCATPPVTARLAMTPNNTPMAHAQVMTIHPEFCAFDLLSSTPATTPSPIRTKHGRADHLSEEHLGDHPLLFAPPVIEGSCRAIAKNVRQEVNSAIGPNAS